MLRQTLAGIALLAVASSAISADTPVQQAGLLKDGGVPQEAACGTECAEGCAIQCAEPCNTQWAESAGEKCVALMGGECAEPCCDTIWAERAGEKCAALINASAGCCDTVPGNCCPPDDNCCTKGACCVPGYGSLYSGISTGGTWKSGDQWLSESRSSNNGRSDDSRDVADDFRGSQYASDGSANGWGGCRSCCCSNLALYPDRGWAPPACNSLNRRGIWYQTMVRQQLYGSPGGGYQAQYPMVYQPTDTTQLGYSYQHVPTWRPRPGSIPMPVPSMYHNRACPGAANGCQVCASGGYHVIQSEYVMAAPQAPQPAAMPASPAVPAQEAQQTAQMIRQTSARRPVATRQPQRVRQVSSSRPMPNNRTQAVRSASRSRRSSGFRLMTLSDLFD